MLLTTIDHHVTQTDQPEIRINLTSDSGSRLLPHGSDIVSIMMYQVPNTLMSVDIEIGRNPVLKMPALQDVNLLTKVLDPEKVLPISKASFMHTDLVLTYDPEKLEERKITKTIDIFRTIREYIADDEEPDSDHECDYEGTYYVEREVPTGRSKQIEEISYAIEVPKIEIGYQAGTDRSSECVIRVREKFMLDPTKNQERSYVEMLRQKERVATIDNLMNILDTDEPGEIELFNFIGFSNGFAGLMYTY